MMISSISCKKDSEVPPTQEPLTENKSCRLVIDVAKEASSQPHTFETIAAMMNGLAQEGIREVCFELIPDTYAATDACQGSVVCDPSIQTDHMHRTVHAVFDPNLAFIQAAKKAGMNVTVIYHPYEGGGSVTIPTQANAQFSLASVAGIGGTASFCSAEVGASKSQLITSIYAENASMIGKGKSNTLEIVFAADAFQNRVSQQETATVTPNAGTEIKPILWYSDYNINYEKAENTSFTVTNETREFTDANGKSLGQKNCRVLKIDVSAYANRKYYAVTFENGSELYTVPFSMITVYDKSGSVISSTKAAYTRNPNTETLLNSTQIPSDYVWGSERKSIVITDSAAQSAFRAWGFEFQYGGCGSDWGDGWHNAKVYGVAVGVQNNLCGNLCEGFESVREYWLGQVDRFWAMGADNVTISLQNAGGMVYNYTDFGYNYMYVKEFKKLYGVDMLTEEFDYLQLMQLRGSYFLTFLQSVDQLAEKNQKKWGIELFAAFEAPALDDDLNGLCYFKMPKIVFDWQEAVRLCDTVLIGDYQYGAYASSVAANIRAYANEQGKSVAVMAYTQCGADAGYIQAAWQDSQNQTVFTDSKDACLTARS